MKFFILSIGLVSLLSVANAQTYPGNMIPLTGGTFTMGNDNQPPMSDNQDPEHEVTVSDFSIGETEVTYEYYVTFLNEMNSQNLLSAVEGVPGDWSNDSTEIANGHAWDIIANTNGGDIWDQQVIMKLSNIAGGGQDSLNRCWIEWDSINDDYSVVAGYENWPVCWVSWYGSMMYCDYYNLSLPTEAEWEYAGKGGQDLEHATNDGSLSYAQANYGSFGATTDPDFLPYPSSVATLFLPNPYGLYNMTGNVSEWCLDWYHPEFYQLCVDSNYTLNPINNWYQDTVEVRILRGGNHTYPGVFATNTNRFDTPPFVTTDHMGFRVVYRSHILGSTSIEEIEKIELFPNPTSDKVVLKTEIKGSVTLEIVNLLGEEVYSSVHENGDTIDMSSFKKGSYFFKIENQTIKIVKQ
ncbi:MAG: SUMF1/EgtB/PvdO family nonheme iron enzyme [Crocinitomicaceae bacterium]|nr:SUMF1/EgtB/PvdO family nonheme iron enzyme [Flavobacteriales bacterium]NQZ34041.1 SUMF1/EgtB/PvdO family nonheme iron enzyme [Crocinitomicaceae bacterium]